MTNVISIWTVEVEIEVDWNTDEAGLKQDKAECLENLLQKTYSLLARVLEPFPEVRRLVADGLAVLRDESGWKFVPRVG